MEEKYYQLGTYTNEQWIEIHNQLCIDTTGLSHIPDRCVTCDNDIVQSPTRGTYLLTDAEAEELAEDHRIKWIHLDKKKYPELFKPPPDELHATSPELIARYSSSVEHHRRFEGYYTPSYSTSSLNRTGYQLLRCQNYEGPWIQISNDNQVLSANIYQMGTGKDVDVIVADDGMWFGHPEFVNHSRDENGILIEKPYGYTGGNPLPGNGYCDLLDLILDAPYYLDPDWFNADPDTRLTTRWDGTIVPSETYGRLWWSGNNYRSEKFANIGNIIISTGYTRNASNGSNTIKSSYGQHGTPCCALTYGRTQGWAYNSNKFAFNFYNYYGPDFDEGFDIVRIFHQYKPINPLYKNRNPTIMSNSWGFRASKGYTNGYYHFRNDSPVQYGGTSSEPAFISHMGLTGDNGRWKSEMKDNAYTESLDELIQSGVIFVVAAGNSNQKQVGSDHPDFDNYISANQTDALADTTFYEFGTAVYGTTNRPGFPQQAGMYTDRKGKRQYPAIIVGALDDQFSSGKERKVNYSDRGEVIDVYAPADGTLAANHSYSPVYSRPDSYTELSNSITNNRTDCAFGGTSAACPVTAGFIATVLEHNRDWTIFNVKRWLRSLPQQNSANFFYGNESATATDNNWFSYNSLEGGGARCLFQGKIFKRTVAGRRAITRGSINFKGGLGLRNKQ